MAAKAKHRKKSRARSATRTIVIANPKHALKNRPRHRRRRRNPPFSIGHVVDVVKRGAIGGVAVVAGEATARLTRSRLFNMTAGETMSAIAEVGVGTALGLVVGYGATDRSMRSDVALDLVKGAYAGVIRNTAKQLGAAYPIITEALGDGPRRNFQIREGRVTRVGAGADRARLNGYVGGARTAQLGAYVAGSVNGAGMATA